MFETISFCIGEKQIEINGKAFCLGELTTQMMNIPKEEYRKMFELAKSAFETLYQYKTPPSKEEWSVCNDKLIALDREMRRYPLLALIKDEKEILCETQSYVSQLSLFDDDEYEMCESEEELRKMILEYGEYLNEWEDDSSQFKESEHRNIKDIPCELLIFPGTVQDKWDYYCGYCSNYMRVMQDIAWFRHTISNFINYYLSALKTLNRDNYAAALNEFLYGELADQLIANPTAGSGLYARADTTLVEYVPRETYEGSDEYKIYTYYKVKRLQAFLKTDFYRALEAGFIIRRCEYCGRYFLLKKAYHTKYCDYPAPDNPRYTCAQLGYRKRGIKEAVPDNPKAQSLKRCLARIEKDYDRKIITAEEKELLSEAAKDMYHSAVTRSGVSNEEFEESLASKRLYHKFGVVRNAKRRGRPKEGNQN